MSALESTLAGFLLKATLVLVAAVAARLALRRASAATRHLIMALAMVGLVLLPFLSVSLPVWHLEVLPASAPTEQPARALPPASLDHEGLAGAMASARTPEASATRNGHPEEAAVAATGGLRAVVAGWLGMIWLLGSVLVLAKLAAGLLRMRWVVSTGERVTDPAVLRLLDECVNVLELRFRPLLISTERADVPLVWGWLRPALVVPREFTGWTPAAMRAVMLHELGHLKRVDWPILLLGRSVVALYWLHPLVWLLERWVKQDCEHACDDIVVTRGTKPSIYASHLLSIARGIPQSSASVRAALAVVRRSQMNIRLRSILDPLLSRRTPSRLAVTGLSTVLLLLVVPLAGVQLAEQAYADEPKPDAEAMLAQHKYQKKHHDDGTELSAGKRAYEQGYKLHEKGHYENAAQAFEEALDLGFKPGTSMYNIACCHALMGEAGQAMSWLERAMEAGFDIPMKLVKDTDFDPIRADNGFQRFIDQAFEEAGLERRSPEHYPYRSIVEDFRKLEQSGSTDGKKWHHVGFRLLAMGHADLAVDAYTEAVEHLGGKKSSAIYNLACAYSLAGQSRAALDRLDEAVEAGFDNQERFLNDPDLDSIRNNSRFERIMEKSEFLSLGRFKKNSPDSPEGWARAVEEYRAYVRDNGSSGRGWYNLGWVLHQSEAYDEAVEAFERSAGLGFQMATSHYNAACGNALLNRTNAALDALEKAVSSGMVDLGHLERDQDLVSLHEEPRFRALLAEIEQKKKAEYEKKMILKKKMKLEKKEQLEHEHRDQGVTG